MLQNMLDICVSFGKSVSDTSLGSGRSEIVLDWHLEWIISKHCGRCCRWMAHESSCLCAWKRTFWTLNV